MGRAWPIIQLTRIEHFRSCETPLENKFSNWDPSENVDRVAPPLTMWFQRSLVSIAGVDYPTLMEEVQSTPAPELRKEALEDIVRASISIRNGLVYVRGYARSSANIRADYAIKSGADIALFYSETADELSFSVRMRPPLDSQLKLHMGSIMKELAGVIQGTGGGHPCAAGAYGKLKRQRDAFIAGFEGRVFGPQQ